MRSRPGLFVGIAVVHGVLAAAFVVFIAVFVMIPADSNVVGLLLFAVLKAFVLVAAVAFIAQTVNALTLLTRLRRDGEPIGTFDYGRRFIELIPYPTTRWSTFWTRLQVEMWQRWPILIGVVVAIVIVDGLREFSAS